MLKGIDALVTPESLYVLGSMGHGDALALVDANFPAASVAVSTCRGRPVVLSVDRLATGAALVGGLLPLDDFEPPAVVRMDPGDSTEMPAVQREAMDALRLEEPDRLTVGETGRHEFYELARAAFAVVSTCDRTVASSCVRELCSAMPRT